ncbi:hypothetical protein AB0N36_21790, partial [Streptomyces acidicola]
VLNKASEDARNTTKAASEEAERIRREAETEAVRDAGGSGLVLLALAAAVLCAWALPPLLFLVPGPLAMALTAVQVRDTGPNPGENT